MQAKDAASQPTLSDGEGGRRVSAPNGRPPDDAVRAPCVFVRKGEGGEAGGGGGGCAGSLLAEKRCHRVACFDAFSAWHRSLRPVSARSVDVSFGEVKGRALHAPSEKKKEKARVRARGRAAQWARPRCAEASPPPLGCACLARRSTAQFDLDAIQIESTEDECSWSSCARWRHPHR